jgi:hypothetical protein
MIILPTLVTACCLSAPAPAVDPQLTDPSYLSEIARHLYRWYLDAEDVTPEINRGEFLFWVRDVKLRLDEDDRSRFGEITLPRLGVCVRVKKPDYAVPELDLVVRSDTYRIINVARVAPTEDRPADAVEVAVGYEQMRDYLFRTRHLLQTPGPELLARFRAAAREELGAYLAARNLPVPDEPQAVHLSPLSPVANEAWVFWENGRILLRFASDIDLADPAVWEHEELAVRMFDLDEQVVVSLDEVAGSNAYLTRDQVGRVLYNCIVLGERVLIEPAGADGSPAPSP